MKVELLQSRTHLRGCEGCVGMVEQCWGVAQSFVCDVDAYNCEIDGFSGTWQEPKFC